MKLQVTVDGGNNPNFEDGLPYFIVQGEPPGDGARFNKKGDLLGPYASACGPFLGADQSARIIGPGAADGSVLWLVNNRGEKLPDHFDVPAYRVLENWSRDGHWRSRRMMALAEVASKRLGFDGLEIVDPSRDSLEDERTS